VILHCSWISNLHISNQILRHFKNFVPIDSPWSFNLIFYFQLFWMAWFKYIWLSNLSIFERTWWRLFQKRVVRTLFDIFIKRFLNFFIKNSSRSRIYFKDIRIYACQGCISNCTRFNLSFTISLTSTV
jgi:hypothetical protein